MTQAGLVSVTICCYNSAKYLRDTIKSVVGQTYRNWELIIVDDGSTDATDAIVMESRASGCHVEYARQKHQGFAAARNKCVEMAGGDYIALLDHDDLFCPRRLEVAMDIAQHSPDAALVFSNTEHFSDDGRVLRRQFDSFAVDPTQLDLRPGVACDQLLIHGCFVDTESALLKTEAVRRVGGFNTEYRYVVDYDLFLRVAREYRLVGTSEVLARWRVHPGQASATMGEIITTEHIALLTRWWKDSRVGAETRKFIEARLLEYLGKRTLQLLKSGKVRPALAEVREAFRYVRRARRLIRDLTQRARRRYR